MFWAQDIEDADEDVLVEATSQLDITNHVQLTTPAEPTIPHEEVYLSDLVSRIRSTRVPAQPSIANPYLLTVPSQMATLPPLISYTPVMIPLTANPNATSTSLLRRDLFDARFQVLTQDEDAAEDDTTNPAADGAMGAPPSATAQGKRKEEFVDEGTDLIKGVYEGGLKTWECSLDLVDCLDGLGYGREVAKEGEGSGKGQTLRGKSILEVSTRGGSGFARQIELLI